MESEAHWIEKMIVTNNFVYDMMIQFSAKTRDHAAKTDEALQYQISCVLYAVSSHNISHDSTFDKKKSNVCRCVHIRAPSLSSGVVKPRNPKTSHNAIIPFTALILINCNQCAMFAVTLILIIKAIGARGCLYATVAHAIY